MELSDKITYLRKSKGWSQEQLAIKLEVSRQAVYKWEAGISQPEIEKLKKISKLFDISFNELLDDSVDISVEKEKSPSYEGETEGTNSAEIINNTGNIDNREILPSNSSQNVEDTYSLDVKEENKEENIQKNKKVLLIAFIISALCAFLIIGVIVFVLVWQFTWKLGPDEDENKGQVSQSSMSSSSNRQPNSTDSSQQAGGDNINSPDKPKENYYTVTFDTEGGSEVDYVIVKEGNLIEKEIITEKAGYILLGWVDIETFEEWNFETDTVTKSMTLYAVWMPSNNVEVTFDKNDGTGEKYTFEIDKTEGLVLTDIFEDSTRALLGFSTSPTGEMEYMVNEVIYVGTSTTFYAVWAPKNVALIIYDKNDGSGEQVWEYVKKNEVIKLSSPFGADVPLGWSRSPFGEIEYDIGDQVWLEENVTLYAQWDNGGFSFTENSDGTYTLESYVGTEETVIIPAYYNGMPVTGIGEYAFSENYTAVSIIIPEGVETIEENSLYGCYTLENIVIPSTVTSISTKAFVSCVSLADIEVNYANEYYQSIDGVLYNKEGTRLINYPKGRTDTDYNIPNGTHYIEDYAFYGSVYLVNVVLPDGVGGVGFSAFEECVSLANIDLGNRIDYVGGRAFYGCISLKKAVFEHELYSIGKEAFYYCLELETVEIYGNVGVISYHTFGDCASLINVIIYDGSVTGELNEDAFEGCTDFLGIKYVVSKDY